MTILPPTHGRPIPCSSLCGFTTRKDDCGTQSANRSQCPQQGQGPGLLTVEIAMINGLVLCLTRVLTRLLSQAQPIRTHNQGPILLVPNSALSRFEASLKRPSTDHHQQCIKSSSTKLFFHFIKLTPSLSSSYQQN